MVDFNPVVGGPIIKDRIWFFGGLRYQYTDSYIGGIWYDKNPSDWIYEPDLNRPANADQLSYDYNVNTTFAGIAEGPLQRPGDAERDALVSLVGHRHRGA